MEQGISDNGKTQTFVNRLLEKLALGASGLHAARDSLEEEAKAYYGQYPDIFGSNMAALQVAYEQLLERHNEIDHMDVPTVVGYDAPRWYLGPNENSTVWNYLKDELKRKGRSDSEITETDRQSTAILSLTHAPADPNGFRHMGLVVGKVQSGKTGNIAATIAKAASTPYRFFLVLSGLTDALRRQTQVRLDNDLNTDDYTIWTCWTAPDQDFVEHPKLGFSFDPSKSQLAVLKKNAAVLRRLLRKLKNTPPAELEKMPFLIIDDEADQASVNSAKIDAKMTVINGLIRQIIDILPKVTYIGYTATPYANVLISPLEKPDELPDLYPKDFIVALNPGDGYFGAESIFGHSALHGDAADDDSDETAYAMVRTVPDDEAALLRGRKGSAGYGKPFAVTASLDRALKYYLLTLAVRSLRNAGNKHSTMLIHTSHLKSKHSESFSALTKWLDAFRFAIDNDSQALQEELAEIYAAESAEVTPGTFGYGLLAFETVFEQLPEMLSTIEVVVENSDSDLSERLDYEGDPRRYIVIGGNVLSRGLTLEGLIVSFFLRTSNQYDTLMQMGRWFGYRNGYEDLPRIWMEESIRRSFRDLAMVEEEIRAEIERYQREQLTPLDFAVRIRSLPGMAVTAKTKMHHARTVQVSYAGTHYQTYRFHRRDRDWLCQNWEAGSTLLDDIQTAGVIGQELPSSTGWIYRHVPYRLVLDFLNRYNVHSSQSQPNREHATEYIRQRVDKGDAAYHGWNVAVLWPANKASISELHLGPLKTVHTSRRSSMNGNEETADIKALMSRRDLTVDLPEHVRHGLGKDAGWDEIKAARRASDASSLLILYPIDRLSTPARPNSARWPLDAVMDVLGMGIMFAGSPNYSGQYISVAHQLPHLEADDDDEELKAGEAELMAELDDETAEQSDD